MILLPITKQHATNPTIRPLKVPRQDYETILYQ